MGKTRWGFDYEFIKIDHGGYRACERKCDRDQRCKAWTYIKVISQCRLKYQVAKATPNRCCVSGVKRIVKTERETQEILCAKFADHAVESQERNLAERCGYRGRHWHAKFSRHYRRCLRMKPAKRRALHTEMGDQVDRCVTLAARTTKLACNHFARVAVAQNKTNIDNDCGYRGEKWGRRPATHVQRCRSTPRAVRFDEFVHRETHLVRCLARGGGAVNAECQRFAATLVAMQVKNRKNRCGIEGVQWHGDASRHYQSCLKRDAHDRSHIIEHAKRDIKKCTRRGRGKFKFLFKF